jgi:hypothetical protein
MPSLTRPTTLTKELHDEPRKVGVEPDGIGGSELVSDEQRLARQAIEQRRREAHLLAAFAGHGGRRVLAGLQRRLVPVPLSVVDLGEASDPPEPARCDCGAATRPEWFPHGGVPHGGVGR